jgi:hypothetical protein
MTLSGPVERNFKPIGGEAVMQARRVPVVVTRILLRELGLWESEKTMESRRTT